MPMRSELVTPGTRVVSQLTSNRYAWNEIVEALRSADMLAVLLFSVIGLIIAVLLIALFPFSTEIASGIASLS